MACEGLDALTEDAEMSDPGDTRSDARLYPRASQAVSFANSNRPIRSNTIQRAPRFDFLELFLLSPKRLSSKLVTIVSDPKSA